MNLNRLSYLKGLGTGIIFTCGIFFLINFNESEINKTMTDKITSVVTDKTNDDNVDKNLLITDSDEKVNVYSNDDVNKERSSKNKNEPEKDSKEDSDINFADTIEMKNISDESVEEVVNIVIPEGYSSRDVAKLFYDAGLVESFEEFDSFIIKNKKDYHIQHGTFNIPRFSTHEEILNIITK